MRRHTVSSSPISSPHAMPTTPGAIARQASASSHARRRRFRSSECPSIPPEDNQEDEEVMAAAGSSLPVSIRRSRTDPAAYRSLPAPLTGLSLSSHPPSIPRSLTVSIPSPTNSHQSSTNSHCSTDSLPSMPTPRGYMSSAACKDSHSNLGQLRRNSYRYQSLRRLGARVSLFSTLKKHSSPSSTTGQPSITHSSSLPRSRPTHRRHKSTIPRSSGGMDFTFFDDTRSVTSLSPPPPRQRRRQRPLMRPSMFEEHGSSDGEEEFPVRPATPSSCSSSEGA